MSEVTSQDFDNLYKIITKTPVRPIYTDVVMNRDTFESYKDLNMIKSDGSGRLQGLEILIAEDYDVVGLISFCKHLLLTEEYVRKIKDKRRR